jgi:hypothetical protein
MNQSKVNEVVSIRMSKLKSMSTAKRKNEPNEKNTKNENEEQNMEGKGEQI